MIRFFEELYLTVFTLGYKFRIAGGWGRINPRFGIIMDTGKGVLLVWLTAFFIIFGIKQYIEIHIGTKFSFDSTPGEMVAVLALYYANHYILVIRGHGVRFEREFNNLKKSKKILLVTTCAVIMLAAIVFSLHMRDVYQHISTPKGGLSGAIMCQVEQFEVGRLTCLGNR